MERRVTKAADQWDHNSGRGQALLWMLTFIPMLVVAGNVGGWGWLGVPALWIALMAFSWYWNSTQPLSEYEERNGPYTEDDNEDASCDRPIAPETESLLRDFFFELLLDYMGYERAETQQVMKAHAEDDDIRDYLDSGESWRLHDAYLTPEEWVKKVAAPALHDEEVIRGLLEVHCDINESNEEFWRIELEFAEDYNLDCPYFDPESQSYVIPKKVNFSRGDLAPIIEYCLTDTFEKAYERIPDHVVAGYEGLSRQSVVIFAT